MRATSGLNVGHVSDQNRVPDPDREVIVIRLGSQGFPNHFENGFVKARSKHISAYERRNNN